MAHRGVVPVSLLVAAAGLLAGCSSPLGRSDADYDRRVSLKRLKTVSTLNIAAAAEEERPAGRTLLDPEAVAAARAAFEEREAVELRIEDVRAAALANNLDLRVSLIEPTIGEQRVREEQGRFEALIFGNAQFTNIDDAVVLATQSAVSEIRSVTPGLRVPLRTGGQAEIRFPVTRVDQDNPFLVLNPSRETNLEFSLSIPLLRGAGRRANSAQIRIADINRQIGVAQAKLQVINQLAAVDRAYWRLYSARQTLNVRYQQYELAVDQLRRARRLFEVGRVAEIEVVRSQSGAADRVEEIIQAQNQVLLQQRELKRLANIPGLDVDTRVNVVTMSDPDPVRYELDPGTLADAAMDERVELLELELRLAADETTEALRRNEALPLLSANFIYRINGLGGSFREAVNVLSENEFEDISVGLNAEIPLGNEQRRAAVRQAVLTRLQRLVTRESRRQAIRQGVFDAVDTIESGWQRILAAQQAVLLNARSLEAEQRQFEVGRSTSTDVLDADTRLAESRLAEIQAVVDYQVAQVDLAVATGTLLGASKVEFDPIDPREELDRRPETYVVAEPADALPTEAVEEAVEPVGGDANDANGEAPARGGAAGDAGGDAVSSPG